VKHWAKTATGPGLSYELDGHTLTRKGRRWLLTFPGGRVEDLGTRATFPTAEAAIVSAAN
jgi:hypothetical protein